MKRMLVTGLVSAFFCIGNANAISVDVQAGSDYTDVRADVGNPNSGLSLNGNWARSNHDGNLASLGTQFALPLGPVSASIGGKALYLSPKNGKDGVALATGLGVNWKVTPSLSLHGEAYGAPENLSSGVKSYYEADIGARYKLLKIMQISAGYRVIEIENKHNQNNKIADGPYIGAGLRF